MPTLADKKLAEELGWIDGEAHAIGICFGEKPAWRYFDTPDEQFEYDIAREKAFNSID